MPNRSMQAKAVKAKKQAVAYVMDCRERERYSDALPAAVVTLQDLVAAYKGPVTRCKAGVRTMPAERHAFRSIVTR